MVRSDPSFEYVRGEEIMEILVEGETTLILGVLRLARLSCDLQPRVLRLQNASIAHGNALGFATMHIIGLWIQVSLLDI